MLESLRCNTCAHCHVCHAVIEETNTLHPCKFYEKKRPTGKWIINTKYNKRGKKFLDCPFCRYGENGDVVCEVSKTPNFCPNCGASLTLPTNRRRNNERV